VAATERRLVGLSRDFAESIQRLLNATICNNIRIGTAVSDDPRIVTIGYGVGKSRVDTVRFPVASRQGKPRCWLKVGYSLRMDLSDDYLTVDKSFIGVYSADDDKMSLCHFDYERDKQGYPEAHLQVHGKSTALAAWSGKPRRELDRLHFPTGGRRYRPVLEDVIEFLIVEGLADGRAGWQDVLTAEREAYWRIQLRAAIRRDPWTALSAMGDPLVA
jgi:hypothetical protein